MSETTKRFITGSLLAALGIFLIFYAPTWCYIVSVLLILLWLLFAEWPVLSPLSYPYSYLIVLIYPVLPIVLIILLQLQTGPLTTAYLFCAVSVHDTCSYIIGKSWGKTKIAPSISPGKTVEGLIGGVSGLLIGNILVLKGMTLILIIILSITISVLAFIGDLFESYLKRKAGIKDSGNILPGHGGVFDRVDSLLFVILLLYPLQYHLQQALSWLL